MTTLTNPLGTKPFWINVYAEPPAYEGARFPTKGDADWWQDEGCLFRLKVRPWIPHDGGPCPVEPHVRVRVRTRGGWVEDRAKAAIWWIGDYDNLPDWWEWARKPSAGDDIIAYQIED